LTNRFGGEVISDRIFLKTPKINTVAVEEDFYGSPKSVAMVDILNQLIILGLISMI
jgi:hypothetical protein